MNETAKICTKCKIEKPLEEFSLRRRGSADGYSSSCKECTNARLREWRRRNPEKAKQHYKSYIEKHPDQIKIREKKRREVPARKEYLRKYQREWQQRKKREWLTSQACENCGKIENLSIVSLIPGTPASKLSPWYGKRISGSNYRVLCNPHAIQLLGKWQSDRTKKMWEDGKFDHIIPLLSARAKELWKQGHYDHIPQCQPGFRKKTKFNWDNELPGHVSYPYIPSAVEFEDMGVEILNYIHEIMPPRIPNDVRADLGQNIALSVMEGKYELTDFEDIKVMKTFITKTYKEHPSPWMLSLDQSYSGDDERTLLQKLEDKKHTIR